MKEMMITFKNPDDILEFVSTVSEYEFDMDLIKGRIRVDAKSILGIMNLGIEDGLCLRMYTDDCGDLEERLEKFAA